MGCIGVKDGLYRDAGWAVSGRRMGCIGAEGRLYNEDKKMVMTMEPLRNYSVPRSVLMLIKTNNHYIYGVGSEVFFVSLQPQILHYYMQLRQLSVLVMLTMGACSATAQGRNESVPLTRKTLTVEELFQLVETNSSSLQSAKTGVQFADLGVASAKTERLPEITTSLSASYNGNVLITNRSFGDVHGYHAPHFGNSFALEAQQALYTGGAQSSAIRMAELGREQATVGVNETRRQLRFSALGQYLDLFKLSNSVRVYKQNIELTRRLTEDISEKYRQGMALQNDVTRYELQMETLKLGLRKLQDQLSILNHQLCTTLGLPAGTVIEPDSTVAQMQTVTGSGTLETALANTPQLQLAQLNVEMAGQRERMARSELLPKVALFAADNFSGPFTYDIPPIDKNVNFWYVGVGLKYSLSSLFKSNRKLQQARTDAFRQQQELNVVRETVDNAVYSAETLYRQAFVEWQTQLKSVELADQNYQVVSDRYLNQLALITDMVDASNLKLNAELQEVNARIGIIFAYYRIKYICGTI